MKYSLFSLLLGTLLAVAFAPFNFWFLAFLIPAGLLAIWLCCSSTQAFFSGWLFGIGFFGAGVSWVYVSLHVYGEIPVVGATLLTAVFVAVLGLFFGVQGYLLTRFFSKTKILAFPFLWIFFEWLRSWLFSGFPWLLLAYSQVTGPLRGFIPILGDYGVGLVILILSVCIAGIFLVKHGLRYLLLGVILLLLSGGYGLTKMHWTKPLSDTMTVTLVQANIPQELKWDRSYLEATLARYQELTQPHWQNDLVVWSEAAIPLALPWSEPIIKDFQVQALENNSILLTGVPIRIETGDYYNAIMTLGEHKGEYYKRQLVPFGEYIPFVSIFGHFFDLLQIPISNFIPGKETNQTLQLGQWRVAPFICYEIAYSRLLKGLDADVNLLVTVSNNAWFGDSLAPHQHLQIAQFRALQLGRYHLFSTSNGITAVISDKGEIIQQAPQFIATSITEEIPLFVGKTPWQKLNHLSTLWLCIMVLLGLLLLEYKPSSPRRRE